MSWRAPPFVGSLKYWYADGRACVYFACAHAPPNRQRAYLRARGACARSCGGAMLQLHVRVVYVCVQWCVWWYECGGCAGDTRLQLPRAKRPGVQDRRLGSVQK